VNPEIGPARPASDLEIGAALATLTAHIGKTDEAKRRMLELAAAHPGDAEIEAGLGGVEILGGDKNAALAHYRSAIEHGAPGWSAHWAYALLLEELNADLPARIQAFTDVLQRNPDLAEAHLRLGQSLLAAGRFSGARARLQQIKPVPVAYVCRWHLEMAHASYMLNEPAEGRDYLEKARAAVRTPQERDAVERLANLIEKSGGAVVAPERPADVPAGDPDPGRPILRRKSPPAKKD
jgi:tetratricopeptide (TPR) repeat protein